MIIACLLAVPRLASAETNAVELLRMEVIAPSSAATTSTGDAWTSAAMLIHLPGVAVRSQGQGVPQSDLIIRGNSFNAGGLLLAGVTLRNPQTEHFQADLTAPGDYFMAPSLLTGLDRFIAGSGHPAGSVALDFAPAAEYRRVSLGFGSSGQVFGRLLLGETADTPDGATTGFSGFCSWDRIDQTDGQPDNDMERWNGGGHAQYRTQTLQADLLTAYTWRIFGARGFYGARPHFPAEEELRQGTVVAALRALPEPDILRRASLAWQWAEDQYWLDRANRSLFANTHVTRYLSGQVATRFPMTPRWSMDTRLDASWEWIDSRYVGTIPSVGLGEHDRGHLSIALLPEWNRGAWRVTAGGSLDLFTEDRLAWLPAAGMAWSPLDGQTLFASYTESVRRPSFTELNYNSPDSLGNIGLERQRMRTWEAGWRAVWTDVACRVTFFLEDGRGVVDWVRRTPADIRWRAVNLERVRSEGVLADADFSLSKSTDLTLAVMSLRKASDVDIHASRYALDYPVWDIRVVLNTRLTSDLTLRAWQGASRFADNTARAGRDCRFESGLETRWRVSALRGLTLVAGVVNIWDEAFEIFPGQPESGRHIHATAEFSW